MFGTKPLSKQTLGIVNWTLGNKIQRNFNLHTKLFIGENASGNIVYEMAAILSRGDELSKIKISTSANTGTLHVRRQNWSSHCLQMFWHQTVLCHQQAQWLPRRRQRDYCDCDILPCCSPWWILKSFFGVKKFLFIFITYLSALRSFEWFIVFRSPQLSLSGCWRPLILFAFLVLTGITNRSHQVPQGSK